MHPSVTPSHLSMPKLKPVCLFLLVSQQGFASGGKTNASSYWKAIPESSQLFPKLDTIFSFPPCRIILFLSSLCVWIVDTAVCSALCPGPLSILAMEWFRRRRLVDFSPACQAEDFVNFPLAGWVLLISVGGGNALHLFEKTAKVPLAKDLPKQGLFTIAKWFKN